MKTGSLLKALSFLIILSFVGLGSCKKKITDPAYCSTAWATAVTDELSTVSAAAMVWAQDPTVANCNLYKAAYQDYLDALEPFIECATWTLQQKQALQDAIDEAEEELQDLC
jgi:hypothetical protein